MIIHEIKPKNAGKNKKSSYSVFQCLSPANSSNRSIIQINKAMLFAFPKFFISLLKIFMVNK